MKVKVLAFGFLTLAVLAGSTNAAASLKVSAKQAEKTNKKDKVVEADNVVADIGSAHVADQKDTLNESKEKGKEVHKRGIFYNSAGIGAASLAAHGHWPKSYASHYDYDGHAHLALPTSISGAPALIAAARPPAILKYPALSLHHKSHIHGLGAAGTIPVPVTFPHAHVSPHVHATPFVLRPGGAVVQSYNVNYPRYHQKLPAVVQPVQSVSPLPASVPLQPAYSVGTLESTAHLHPVQPLATAQHTAHFHPVQHLTPVQNVATLQPLEPGHHVQHIQPVQAIEPLLQHINPSHQVHPIVQVEQSQQFYPLSSPQHAHHYFQTTLVQPADPVASYIPQFPAAPPLPPPIAAVPSIPSIPATPSLPVPSAFPVFPQLPVPPSPPAIPAIPAVPVSPVVPALPTAPALPPAPANSIFPLGVQPPQQTPSFISFPPHPSIEAQFPGILPVPSPNRPDSGSAVASPQIPNLPSAPPPQPEPELPFEQPPQEPWRPIFQRPAGTVGPPVNLNRPSITLLPPYEARPAEGYLPPVIDSQHHHNNNNHHHEQLLLEQQHILQQHLHQSDNIFEHLSDAEIENIFAQANLAVQQQERRKQQQKNHRQHLVIHSHRSGYDY